MMTKTEYLYDVQPQHFEGFTFYDAIKERIRLGKELLYFLVHVKNETYTKRVEDIQKAIDWNKKILLEQKQGN